MNAVGQDIAALRAQLRGDGFCRKHRRQLGPSEWVCLACANERADACERQERVDAVRAWWACAMPVDELGGLPAWGWARPANASWRSACKPRVLAALDAWTPGQNLVVLAGTGSGKTSGTVARLHDWRSALLRDRSLPILPFAYASALDLVEAEKRRKLGDGAHPLLHAAQHREVLVLDEAQLLPPTLAMQVIDERYRKGLGTLLLGGVSARDFGTSVGAAVLRRFLERGRLVDLCKGAG
jgi:hypothetical protein